MRLVRADPQGKWLEFISEENADVVWAKIVKAVCVAAFSSSYARSAYPNGPCRGLVVTAKIASSDPLRPTCLYVADSWDKETVKAALASIIRGVGLVPTAFKVRSGLLRLTDECRPTSTPVRPPVSDRLDEHRCQHRLKAHVQDPPESLRAEIGRQGQSRLLDR